MALALVLWLVVLLGTVAAAVITSSRSGTGVVLNARARTVARYAAESGIVATVALVEHQLVMARSPGQQAAAFAAVDRELVGLREVSLGNARFAVTLENLNARLDLNQADPRALFGLFSNFTSKSRARAVVDAIQDWQDADDLVRPEGAERHTYLRLGSHFVPPNAPFTRVDEIRRIRGVTDSLTLAVEPYLTVAGSAEIDVNGAPELILATLPEVGPAGARALVSRRAGGAFFSSVGDALAVLGPVSRQSASRLRVAPNRVLITSRGWMPGHPLTHEIQAGFAVVDQRLMLLSWRERDL